MAQTFSPDHLQDPVTAHMRKEVTLLQVGHTVAEALEAVRRQPPEERILYFYVVDPESRLVGVVPTRRLLLSGPDALIADIMVSRVIALPAEATVLDACEFFILHRFLAFPVVDEAKRILGVVDVELYTGELADLDETPAQDTLFQLIGIHLSQAEQTSPRKAFLKRFPWLLCNIGGGILAAFLSGIYQVELAWEGAVLALFIPVVLALAESVSIQSVSLALQTFSGSRPTWGALAGRLLQEMGTGILLGAACGLLVGGVAYLWIGSTQVVFCLLGGIAGGVTCAAVIGLALPYLFHLFSRDPQVASGPIALTLSDMTTLLLYFNLARWLLAR